MAAETVVLSKCQCTKEFAAYDGSEGKCPTCTVAVVHALKKSLEVYEKPLANGKSIKEVAESAQWMQKSLTADLGLDLDGYEGRPAVKALRAIYDTSMFNAVNAAVSLAKVDGPSAKSLRDFAVGQIEQASKAVTEFKAQFPEESTDWAVVSPGEIADSYVRGDVGEGEKKLVTKCAEWALRTKGWGRGHTCRIRESVKVFRELMVKPSDKPITPEERAEIGVHIKGLEEMLSDNGRLVSINDRETDATIAKITAHNEENQKSIVAMKKRLAAAASGQRI